MLAKNLHRARLWPAFPTLFGKRHCRSNRQLRYSIEHAVAVKIDLLAITGFDKAKFAARIELDDLSHRLHIMMFDVPGQSPDLILQLSPRSLEGIVDCKRVVSISFVGRRRSADVDLTAIRQRQTDMNMVEPARLVPLARSLDRDSAGANVSEPILELGYMLFDGRMRLCGFRYVMKLDLNRRLHSLVSHIWRGETLQAAHHFIQPIDSRSSTAATPGALQAAFSTARRSSQLPTLPSSTT